MTEAEGTWTEWMGLKVLSATGDRVEIELPVTNRHRQQQGLVHGGVYCGLIETAASLGASVTSRARGQLPPVGMENHTSFIRPVQTGILRVTATALMRGRTTQLWDAVVRSEDGKLVASGRVRLACKDAP
jgi:1,4-dihydroxy-2-naphthoyl-CoA hydrolase